MVDTFIVAERFHGPPRSGNGGYVCGRAAQYVGGAAEVTLRAPPPLETPIEIVREGERVRFVHGGHDIVQARPARPEGAPPASPGLAAAQQAAARYLGHKEHFFPSCFTCGPAHPTGLHVFSGVVDDAHTVASPWIPGADLAASDGLVAPEFLWAALDCPTYWSLPQAGAIAALLGRLTAETLARPPAGAPLVVVAAPLGSTGRKHRAASAIYTADGALVANGEATWIQVEAEHFQ